MMMGDLVLVCAECIWKKVLGGNNYTQNAQFPTKVFIFPSSLFLSLGHWTISCTWLARDFIEDSKANPRHPSFSSPLPSINNVVSLLFF